MYCQNKENASPTNGDDVICSPFFTHISLFLRRSTKINAEWSVVQLSPRLSASLCHQGHEYSHNFIHSKCVKNDNVSGVLKPFRRPLKMIHLSKKEPHIWIQQNKTNNFWETFLWDGGTFFWTLDIFYHIFWF